MTVLTRWTFLLQIFTFTILLIEGNEIQDKQEEAIRSKRYAYNYHSQHRHHRRPSRREYSENSKSRGLDYASIVEDGAQRDIETSPKSYRFSSTPHKKTHRKFLEYFQHERKLPGMNLVKIPHHETTGRIINTEYHNYDREYPTEEDQILSKSDNIASPHQTYPEERELSPSRSYRNLVKPYRGYPGENILTDQERPRLDATQEGTYQRSNLYDRTDERAPTSWLKEREEAMQILKQRHLIDADRYENEKRGKEDEWERERAEQKEFSPYGYEDRENMISRKSYYNTNNENPYPSSRDDEQMQRMDGLYQEMHRREMLQREEESMRRSFPPYANQEQLSDPGFNAPSNYFQQQQQQEAPFYKEPTREYNENQFEREQYENQRREQLEREEYENQRRSGFEGGNFYGQQSIDQQSPADTGRPRNDIPNDQYMNSKVVQEFLKLFATQNQLPSGSIGNENQGFLPTTNQMPSNMFNQRNQISTLQQPTNFLTPAYNFLGSPAPANPNISPIIPQFPGLNMANNGPTPQMAAFMSNMATPPGSFNPMDLSAGNNLANQNGVVMLMVATPPGTDKSDSAGSNAEKDNNKKEKVEHQELTPDGIKRTSSNTTNDDFDFSANLKTAADYVLRQAVTDGNITATQRSEIENKLITLLEKRYQNKTKGEIRAQTRAEIPRIVNGVCIDARHDCDQFQNGGVCPFMRTFMKGSCSKTCQGCPRDEMQGVTVSKIYDVILKNSATAANVSMSGLLDDAKGTETGTAKSKTPKKPKGSRKINFLSPKVPRDPVMYLSFENSSRNGDVPDESGNKNNAHLDSKASVSQRSLGTCGRAVELNEGSISWNGDTFHRKPEKAISIAMWIKVKKSGIINWFANGKKGDKTFYTRTKGSAVPAKVWTHVAGTFDSTTGLARIYINGEIEREEQQSRGRKLAKNWLVNGIGAKFSDDSLHYVDEVVIYDRALTSGEVKSLFNRCIFNRMVLHFGFQNGNNTNMNDQSGLENNGILVGGAEQKSSCDRCGACLDLTKGPDPTMRIQQISLKFLPKIKVSIGAWVSLNSTRGVHNIFTTESSEGNIGYRLQVVNGKIRWAIGTDSIPVLFDNMTKQEVIPEALWTHVVVSYNNENGAVKMYSNGLLKFSHTVPEDNREYLPRNWENDASICDRTFRGYLDEFIMYNWELDESEVLYVRNYCADHPKLVRFTVRVPLTKKTIVPRVTNGLNAVSPHWWNVYRRFERERTSRTQKGKSATRLIDRNGAFTLLKHKK